MQSMWKKLIKIPGLTHVFTVPCDSHGLQLIIKDLLQRSQIEKVFREALSIVNKFRNTGKQLSLLGVEQERVYKKKKTLQTSTDIRWGSQYNMLKSVNDSREALRNFAYRDDIDNSYKYLLLEPGLWAALTQLLELLEPIYNLQKGQKITKRQLATYTQDG
jgi:hypothetical protein